MRIQFERVWVETKTGGEWFDLNGPYRDLFGGFVDDIGKLFRIYQQKINALEKAMIPLGAELTKEAQAEAAQVIASAKQEK